MAFAKADPGVRKEIERQFPQLAKIGYTITSPQTPIYNCIAWAAGDSTKWWWPVGKFWPAAPRSVTVSAFVMMFSNQGYFVCKSEEVEAGIEKIALYAKPSGDVTHAARQLSDGLWTSKLGREFDISHTLRGLEGGAYGTVVTILKRPAPVQDSVTLATA